VGFRRRKHKERILMGRRKTKTKYNTVKIPDGITAIVDELQEKSKGGYTSRTDVIKTAIRILYDKEIRKAKSR
jgi:Arc/MetJ-type ribon-helix-helix transcriptional regulator